MQKMHKKVWGKIKEKKEEQNKEIVSDLFFIAVINTVIKLALSL